MTAKVLAQRTSGVLSDLRRASAFIFRDYHLTRRYFSWVIVFAFYAIVNSATIVLIGVAAGDQMQTLNLLLGVLLWSYLGALFHEIANSISYERWEGTIEYTFMAPVSRVTHLFGVSIFASIFAFLRLVVIVLALVAFAQVSLEGANIFGVLAVMFLASLSFMAIGLIAAILPLLSPEKGAQGANILQGCLLLVSGVYYPISVLPDYLQPFSYISPATYALDASRKLLGIGIEGSLPGALKGQSLAVVVPELWTLTLFGLIGIPVGVYIFSIAEKWAKKNGKLKRSG